jgi:hypothetical protein
LRNYGLTDEVIDLAWPSWWSDEAETSASATAELRFSLARRLGLDARELLRDEPVFVWKVGKFKSLKASTALQQDAIISYCTSVARVALSALPAADFSVSSANAVRGTLLKASPYVDLGELITYCWAVGIPAMSLSVFPLTAKRMHAMAVRVGDRYAILLARETRYPAQAAFDVAHELGHIALGHLQPDTVLADLDDPLQSEDEDQEEVSANQYALELLTGESAPRVLPNVDRFLAQALANAAMEAAPQMKIDAGTLVLCLGHETGRWDKVIAALKHIYGERGPIGPELNAIAMGQMAERLSIESEEFLRGALGIQ